mgnify:CR=1 FL=1
MSLQVENLEHNMAKLTITVSAEEVEKALQAAYLKQRSKISLPGLRKGNVPRQMIEKMYGPEVFYDEAANNMISEAYGKAYDECELEIASQQTIDVVQLEKGKDFIFTAEVAVKPEVKLGEYKGLKVDKVSTRVMQKEVDEEIEKERERNARTVEVTDRAVQDKDIVTLDFEGFVDGVAFEGGKGENYPLTIGSGAFIPGFEEQLVGKNAGDDVDVNVTFPEEYHAEDLAGKEATFKVTVKGVRSSFLPELSDEVVQKISQCKTVAEFEEFVRKSIHDFKQNQADMEKENKVLEQIVEASEIEVPQEFIDERKEQLKNNLLAQLRNAGNTFEQYLQYNGLTEELFEEYAAKDALSMLKGQAVLQEIAKAEGFSETDEDVDQTIAAMAISYQMPAEQLREMMGERGVAMVAEDILSKQALEFIVKEAVEA